VDLLAWHRVVLDVAGEDSCQGPSPLTQALFAEGAVAVEREGALLVGHFLEGPLARAAAEALGASARAAPVPDWGPEWLSGHRAFAVSPRLCVAPSFVAAPPAEVVLRIDPGLAFGTASHPTTFLCLEALGRLLAPGAALPSSLLDVGCGTGVLAIAALRLGVGTATGTDLDPFALRAARRIARKNGIGDARLALSDAPADQHGRFPLVVANLPPPALEAVCEALGSAVDSGGALLLSGYFADCAPAVEHPFLRRGFALRERRTCGEWGLALLGRQ
jgi:ribosomal protein L11 methyltransferase